MEEEKVTGEGKEIVNVRKATENGAEEVQKEGERREEKSPLCAEYDCPPLRTVE